MDVTDSTLRRPIARRQAADFTEQLIEPFTLPTLKLGRFAAVPALEMCETDKSYKITAEIAGVDPQDLEVTFEDGLLRIAGEKKEEREENERGYRLSERSYGAFERLIELPSKADPNKIDAKFKNGVLRISVAKNGKNKANVRRISIKGQPDPATTGEL